MVTIRIFGTTPPCAKCKRAEREAAKAAASFNGQVRVIKVDALGPEAEPFGLIVTPTVAIDEQIVASGRVAPHSELAERLHSLLGEK